jgi:hypothetical protein
MGEGIGCPKCGGQGIVSELRDAEGSNPPPNSYGEWFVCPSCHHEWQGAVGYGWTDGAALRVDD